MCFVHSARIAINIVIPCGTQVIENDAATHFFAFFSEGFRTRACKDTLVKLAQKRFFCNVKKMCAKNPKEYVRCGLLRDPPV